MFLPTKPSSRGESSTATDFRDKSRPSCWMRYLKTKTDILMARIGLCCGGIDDDVKEQEGLIRKLIRICLLDIPFSVDEEISVVAA